MKRSTLVLLLLLVSALLASSCRQSHEFAGTELNAPHPVPDVELMSIDGPVQLSDFRGKWTFVYFGYTFCPDACPLTLSRLTGAIEEMPERADDIQVVMVSVDPERDTPEVLAEYMAYFHDSFVGITGSKEDIDALGEPFGIFYEKGEGSEATGYLVTHSTRFYLVDPEGNARIAYPHETTESQVIADLKYFFESES